MPWARWIGLYLLAATATTARATTGGALALAAHVPASAVLYAGWAGADALAPACQDSNLQAVASQMNLRDTISPLVPPLVKMLLPDHGSADSAPDKIALASLLWEHPTCIAIDYAAPADPGDAPILHPELLCDAGADAPRLIGLLRRDLPDDDSLHVAAEGTFVRIASATGEPPMRATAATSLLNSPSFHAAMDSLQPSPAVALFINAQPLLHQANQAAAASSALGSFGQAWPALRRALGIGDSGRFGYTAGFDGKDWASRWALLAAAPRTGVTAALEPQPADPALLARIPASARSASINQLDLSALVYALQAASEEHSATGDDTNFIRHAIAEINSATGIDVQRDILHRFGKQWATLASDTPATEVVINHAPDAQAAVTALATALQNIITRLGPLIPKPQLSQHTYDGIQYWMLSMPRVRLSFAAHGAFFYLALLHRDLAAAANAADVSPDAQIQHSAAFQAALQRLDAPACSNFDYTDLPHTAAAAYQSLNASLAQIKAVAAAHGWPAIPLQLPPLEVVLPHLSPSLTVSWADAHGIYSRSISPFPLSSLMSNPNGTLLATGGAFLAVSMGMPALNRSREIANRVACATNERTIMQYVLQYAQSHDGKFPPTLAALVLDQNISPQTFVCPDTSTTVPPAVRHGTPQQQADWVAAHSDYIYLGAGKTIQTPANQVVLTESQANHHDGMNLAFADGRVLFFPPDQAARYLSVQPPAPAR